MCDYSQKMNFSIWTRFARSNLIYEESVALKINNPHEMSKEKLYWEKQTQYNIFYFFYCVRRLLIRKKSSSFTQLTDFGSNKDLDNDLERRERQKILIKISGVNFLISAFKALGRDCCFGFRVVRACSNLKY